MSGDAVRAGRRERSTQPRADRLRPEEIYGEEEVPRIRPSRGTHVTLAREALDVRAGVIVLAGEGRTAFALPWLGRTLIGTTDNDYDGELEHVPPSAADVEYLLDALNSFFERRSRRPS